MGLGYRLESSDYLGLCGALYSIPSCRLRFQQNIQSLLTLVEQQCSQEWEESDSDAPHRRQHVGLGAIPELPARRVWLRRMGGQDCGLSQEHSHQLTRVCPGFL